MLRLDKFGSPYFDESSVDTFFNDSYYEWIDSKAKLGEVSDRNRQSLGHLVHKKELTGAIINLSSFDPKPLRLWAVLGNFDIPCLDGVYTRSILPKKWDEFGVAMDNPFEVPSNTFPIYVQSNDNGNNVLTIYSDTPPQEVEVVYIKEPILMDSDGNPDGFIEVGRNEIYQIVDICLRKMELTIENQFRTQGIISTELPQNQ